MPGDHLEDRWPIQTRTVMARRNVLLAGWSGLLNLNGFKAMAEGGSGRAAEGSASAGQDMPLTLEFASIVHPQLQPTVDDQARYAEALQGALEASRRQLEAPQFTLLVDRSPQVQAMLIFWGGGACPWQVLGASPVSTGLPGRYGHFATPLGVFEHDPANLDFRAEGTRNALGIRGYGVKGSRVFDFGWVQAPKGWGDQAISALRLQMHATDPDRLEPLLGSARSKGCIRISALLNEFIDRYGLIDQAYEQAVDHQHRVSWVLRKDRFAGPWAGRYMAVVDSLRSERPAWSPLPPATKRRAPP